MEVSTTSQERPGVADVAAYWLTLLGIYVLVGFLWYYPFKEKVFDDNLIAPDPVKDQFAGSFIDSFPGTSVAWGILGIAQGLLVVGLIISLLNREFLPQRSKPWLLGSLAFSMVLLAMMLFAERMTSEFDITFQLFSFFGATAVIFILILLMPPYRPMRWLSSPLRARGS